MFHKKMICQILDGIINKMNSLICDYNWRTPNSLRDSNVNPKLKTTEEKGVGAIPWLVAL
jgi:hypothetical protein